MVIMEYRMWLDPVTADAGQRLLDLFVEELSQTVNGVVYAASPAAQEHFTSGFLEMERGSALRTRDLCFSHSFFCFITLPQSLPSREGKSAGTPVRDPTSRHRGSICRRPFRPPSPEQLQARGSKAWTVQALQGRSIPTGWHRLSGEPSPSSSHLP